MSNPFNSPFDVLVTAPEIMVRDGPMFEMLKFITLRKILLKAGYPADAPFPAPFAVYEQLILNNK